jgi:hypothetical protein
VRRKWILGFVALALIGVAVAWCLWSREGVTLTFAGFRVVKDPGGTRGVRCAVFLMENRTPYDHVYHAGKFWPASYFCYANEREDNFKMTAYPKLLQRNRLYVGDRVEVLVPMYSHEADPITAPFRVFVVFESESPVATFFKAREFAHPFYASRVWSEVVTP